MPVFEFRCRACGKKFSTLVGVTSEADEEQCPHCGSQSVTKLVSRFFRARSEDDRIEEMADRLDSIDDPDSGSQMRDMAREMGKALDEDVSDEMEEMLEADFESGEEGDLD